MFLAVLLNIFLVVTAQTDDIPEPLKPKRLVNDFVGFLTPGEQSQLEQKLVAIDDSTSTQIAVVIVKSLNGYEISDLAVRIGVKWGVGQKGKNNGIVILVKPKVGNEKGDVWIATGYGAESVVTDVLGKRIVENEIIPSFKSGRYYEGLDKAVNTLYSLMRGEFTPDQYMKKKGKGSKFPVALIIILGVILVSIFGSNSSNKSRHISNRRGSDIPFWLLMGGMMGSGRSSGSGSFGGFSGGSGGFGGFGGGSFGGGGAGGSW
jgi:uncharacterized protein